MPFADVTEVEIENHRAMVRVHRDDIVGVHVSLVAVDHKIRILPEVPGAVAFARGAGSSILFGGNHRAGLQTVTILVFDGVLLVIKNRTQSFMQMRNVIPAIEVVIHIDLPITANVITAAVEVMQFADAERSDARPQPAEKLRQRRRVRIEIDKDEALPGFDTNRNEPILRSLKILHTFELGHALKRAVHAVLPPVVGTLENFRAATGLGYDSSSVMAAHVIESAQTLVCPPDHNDGLADQSRRHEVAR